jgi:hypothetical protein
MSLSKLLTVVLVSLLSFSTQAFETAVKPHAMLYVSIPLDGKSHDRDSINYGFRLDNVEYTPGKPVNYQQQLQRTAVMDIRMDEHGMDGLYISGIDYLQMYRVNRQNEDQGGDAAPDAASSADGEAVAAEAEAEEDVDDGLTVGDRIRGVIADMRATAPMGVYMGIGLGIGLLLGVDD